MKQASWLQIALAVAGGLLIAIGAVIFSFAVQQSGVVENCYTGLVGGGIAVVCPPGSIETGK